MRLVQEEYLVDLSKVYVLVTAYNEETVIGDVLSKLYRVFQHVVVVDDCSTDQTGAIAKKHGAFVIRHPINLGQGAALQTGIEHLIRTDAQVIVTFDADGQHRVEDGLMLAVAVLKDEADILCGSRFLGIKSSTMPKAKFVLLKMAALFTRMTTGVPVTDAHNGLRAFNIRSATKIKITQNRMAHASEIVSQIKKNHLRYKEYPVLIQYTEYSISKGQRITNAINILIDLFFGGLSK
jgi:glycosyltransferase involved in cell wall biosynthesis